MVGEMPAQHLVLLHAAFRVRELNCVAFQGGAQAGDQPKLQVDSGYM